MKTIFAMAHGAKEKGPNPPLTLEGKAQNASLQSALKEELKALGLNFPSQTWIGGGLRFLDVAQALGLEPTHLSELVGTESSVERRQGEDETQRLVLVLPDSREWPYDEKYARSLRPSIVALLASDEVENGAVFCTGREFISALTGDLPWKIPTALYKIEVMDDGTVRALLVEKAAGKF